MQPLGDWDDGRVFHEPRAPPVLGTAKDVRPRVAAPGVATAPPRPRDGTRCRRRRAQPPGSLR